MGAILLTSGVEAVKKLMDRNAQFHAEAQTLPRAQGKQITSTPDFLATHQLRMTGILYFMRELSGLPVAEVI